MTGMMMPSATPKAPAKKKAVSYDPMARLREWHIATEQRKYTDEPDAMGRRDSTKLSLALIKEEFKEVADELLDFMNSKGSRINLAKELADLLYVTYRVADIMDIPLEAVFNAVHESNMTKVGANGKVEKRSDGKILKGPNYKAPDIASVVLPGVSS